MTSDLEPLLTVADVAELLSLKVGRIYALAESRDPRDRLPSIHVGRSLRFRPADVERYLDERVSS